jgi:hypothetical protein
MAANKLRRLKRKAVDRETNRLEEPAEVECMLRVSSVSSRHDQSICRYGFDAYVQLVIAWSADEVSQLLANCTKLMSVTCMLVGAGHLNIWGLSVRRTSEMRVLSMAAK